MVFQEWCKSYLKFYHLPNHPYHLVLCAVSFHEISNSPWNKSFILQLSKWIILCSHGVLKSWDKFISVNLRSTATPPPCFIWGSQWTVIPHSDMCIKVNTPSNHHSSAKNEAQFCYLGFRNEKRKGEKKNPKKSVSKAVSKTTFLRNLKIRASFFMHKCEGGKFIAS